MQHPDESYLQDVLDAARLIREFVQGFDMETFRADVRTHSAVIRQLEIMGRSNQTAFACSPPDES